MRLLLAFSCALTLSTGQALAQDPGERHPYQLDPYKTSEAALLRQYGATLVSQTPPSELKDLDPYKPSHAALLRMGGALPIWPWPAYWPANWPGWAAAPSFVVRPGESAEHLWTRRSDREPHVEYRRPDQEPVTAPEPGPTSIATLRRPESSDGIWIEFAGRRWIADGRAVPYVDARFARIGDRGGHPVYREATGSAERIFIPTGDDVVAPFRPR
jgi:hypothetical protein